LRHVCATVVAVGRQIVLHIVGVRGLRYPSCNAHRPYCHLWPVRLYSIFLLYLINGTIIEKKTIKYKIYVFIISTTLSETFLILRSSEWDMIKNVFWSSRKVPVILVTIYRCLKFLGIFSKKYSNIIFHENPYRGNGVLPCRQTDRHDEADSCISQNCEKRPIKLKILIFKTTS